MTVLRKRNIIADSAPVAKSGHAPPDAALFPGVAAQKPPWIYRNDLPPDGIHGAEGTCEAHGLRAKVIQPAAREPRRRVPQRSPCRVSCSDAPKQRTIAGLTARNSSVTLRRDRATAGIPMAIPPGRFGSASMMTSKYGSRAQGQPDTAREATASVRSGKGRLDDAPHPAGRRKAGRQRRRAFQTCLRLADGKNARCRARGSKATAGLRLRRATACSAR